MASYGLFLYLSSYDARDLMPVGWDVHSYVWQTKAIGEASLAQVTIRPGFPALASLFGSLLPVDPAHAVVAFPPALAVAMGGAAAAGSRLTYRLPGWATPAILLVVTTWVGTARLVAGYEAALLNAVLVVAAAVALVHAAGRARTVIVAAAMLFAAALAHVVFFAIFAGIVALYVLTSIPALVRDVRAGRGVLRSDAAAASLAVGGAAVAGAATMLGWLGLDLSDPLPEDLARSRYATNTQAEIKRARLPLLGSVAALGLLASRFRTGDEDESDGDTTRRPARAMTRFGLAWLAVCAAIVILAVWGGDLPGHRALIFAIPFPVAVGLGIVHVARIVGGSPLRARGRQPRAAWSGWPRAAIALCIVAAATIALAVPGHRYFRVSVRGKSGPAWTELRAAGAYLETVPGERPAVFLVNQSGYWGAYTPKLRLSLARSSVPDEYVVRTYVYMGTYANLVAGRPTMIPVSATWQADYNALSLVTWRQVKRARAQGAVVMVLRHLGQKAFSDAMEAGVGGLVAPGVYVLDGPLTPLADVPQFREFTLARAGVMAVLFLALLGLAGWGFVLLALGHARPRFSDVVVLAPAFGAAACTIAAVAIAGAGGDPGGGLGVVGFIAVAASSSVIGVASLRRGSTRRSDARA